MKRDLYGNIVTTASADTIAAVNIYTADWIGYGQRLRTIFAAADADPDCAFVNACAASVHMALEARSGMEAAQPYLARMRAQAHDTTDREFEFVGAVDAWSRGDARGALEYYRDLAEQWPSDIASAKWGQYIAFNLGHSVAMRSLAGAIVRAHRDTAEAWSMLAFGEEQCHRLEAAEDAALHAYSLKQSDPWAHHAIAHVYESQDRTRDAIRFLHEQSQGWVDRSIFVRGHNWWHLALFHLDRGEHHSVLDIYDDHLFGIWPEFGQEQVGAISALWRLEMMGVDVGHRWQPLAKKIAERGFEHILPFHDLHFVYALARAGKTKLTDEFLHSLAMHAVASQDDVWATIAAPAAQALVAFARGQYARASLTLQSLLGQLHRIGGSHAQRDVFLQTWIVAALKAREHTTLEDVLTRCARHRAGLGTMRRFIRYARHHHKAPTFLHVA
jgi:hypothetical protein